MSERKQILPMTQKRIDAFWKHVDVRTQNECWPWTAGKDTNGYGVFQASTSAGMRDTKARSKRCIRSHRIAFALSSGHEPINLVCHKCDNPSCCNPHHLFDGTSTDNVWDMHRKLRGHTPYEKLTREQVLEIRALYPPPTDKLRPRGRGKRFDGTPRYADIALQYGIDTSTVERIANRKIWRHL